MEPEPERIEVSATAADVRLDRFLAGPLGSRARAQQLIETGHVRVDGQVRPKRHVLAAGEVVEIQSPSAPAAPSEPSGADPSIAYEDEYLLVVDKPAGVVVHPARGHRSGTLAQALRGRAVGGEDPSRAGIVHRLDRDTSGLLVVAKRDDVHRRLKTMLAARQLHREYLALVDGVPEARTGTIEAPIGRHRQDRKLMSIDSEEPRPARTHFRVLEILRGVTLLAVVLDTGRTHQIRVHMAAIGHPVCGDVQYRGPMRYGLHRQFLHAHRLEFPHPVTAARLDLRSPLPADLQSALDAAVAAAGHGLAPEKAPAGRPVQSRPAD